MEEIEAMKLNNKVILVTGAAGALGRAVCEELLKDGATVLAADIAEEKLKDMCGELSAFGSIYPYVINVMDRNDVRKNIDAIIERFGRLDGLYNNAGVNKKNLITEYPDEDMDMILNLNLRGAYIMASEAAKPMIKAGKGRIVNVSSLAAYIPEYSNSVYSMSKAAISKLTECMVAEWARYGVSAVAIAPGKVNSAMAVGSMHRIAEQSGRSYEDVYNETVSGIPAGRLLEASEVAYLAAFLFDDRASYIMGNTILIAGGVGMH